MIPSPVPQILLTLEGLIPSRNQRKPTHPPYTCNYTSWVVEKHHHLRDLQDSEDIYHT